MNNLKELDRLIMKYLIVLALLSLFLLNLGNISQFLKLTFTIFTPIIIGFALAYIMNILMEKIEGLYFPNTKKSWLHKSRRPFSMGLSIIIIGLVIYLVMSLIIPQLYSVILEIIDIMPTLLDSLKAWVAENEKLLPQVKTLIDKADFQMEQILTNTWSVANNVTQNVLGKTLTTVGSVFNLVFNGLLSLMISLYVLASKEKLGRQFKRLGQAYLPQSINRKMYYVLDILNQSFRHFITGEVTEAFILGMMVTIGMWAFRFPYAGMIGALTGFTALIPLVGAYISGILGFLLIFTQSPVQGGMFLIFIIVIQQLEGNLIYPKVVGDSIGLPGIWVLISITIGGGLWGIAGMLLAVPLASAAYKLLKNQVDDIERNISFDQDSF